MGIGNRPNVLLSFYRLARLFFGSKQHAETSRTSGRERERERETLKYGKFAASPCTNVTRSRGDKARLVPLSLSLPLSLTDDSRFEIGARASVLISK